MEFGAEVKDVINTSILMRVATCYNYIYMFVINPKGLDAWKVTTCTAPNHRPRPRTARNKHMEESRHMEVEDLDINICMISCSVVSDSF